MNIKALVGAGHRVVGLALPFLAAGLAANLARPTWFALGAGSAGRLVAVGLLVPGVALWLGSVVQILVNVPRGRLITTGPYALVLHPLYTSVALLVLPGLGMLFDSWLGLPLGAILYGSSRLFSGQEERELAARFPQAWPEYRRRVLLPWL